MSVRRELGAVLPTQQGRRQSSRLDAVLRAGQAHAVASIGVKLTRREGESDQEYVERLERAEEEETDKNYPQQAPQYKDSGSTSPHATRRRASYQRWEDWNQAKNSGANEEALKDARRMAELLTDYSGVTDILALHEELKKTNDEYITLLYAQNMRNEKVVDPRDQERAEKMKEKVEMLKAGLKKALTDAREESPELAECLKALALERAKASPDYDWSDDDD